MQGSIGSYHGCVLSSLLVTWTSHPLIYLGSYGCCPGPPLVSCIPSPLSRSTGLMLCRLSHNNCWLWRDGGPTSLPSATISPVLHIPALRLVCCVGCRTLPCPTVLP